MRPLDKVIEAILNVVPDSYEEKKYLKMTLDNILESYNYSAPEAATLQWEQTSIALLTYVGKPDIMWKREVANIFGNVVDYSDYLVNA